MHKSLSQKQFQNLLVYVSGPRFQLALDVPTTNKILALFDKSPGPAQALLSRFAPPPHPFAPPRV